METTISLTARKPSLPTAFFSDINVVACKIDSSGGSKGFLIVVESDAPGFSRGRKLDKMGWRMQDTGELFFEDCRVPVANLLGEEGKGFKYMMEMLCRERLTICLDCQTLAEECLKEALEYSKVREAFGRPIGNFQHNAFKLARMATEVEMGRTFLNALVASFIKGVDITMKVSMAKAWVGEMAQRVAYDAVNCTEDTAIWKSTAFAVCFRDLRVFRSLEGLRRSWNSLSHGDSVSIRFEGLCSQTFSQRIGRV
jgi:acyl-CoA dehydrogenase